MFRKVSIFWILLVAILITSGVPLGLLAYNVIRATESGVEREQLNQLGERVHAHAATINGQFHEFQTATGLAAAEAKSLLLAASPKISPEEIEQRLGKYARDANNVFGLDAWYNTVYLPQAGDNRQSNVFVNKDTALTPKMAYDIAVTEDLNPLFEQIKDSGIGTQWIYLTTAEGMLRLYPWAGNEGYPVDWQPQTISFYTVAAPERNPDRKSVWTAPYNDFDGAGVMVTNSLPIYDGDRLVAVMSHDFLIKDLQKQVLGFKVGEQGFAFLLDQQGNIVAHKDYNPENTKLGEELNVKLADRDSATADVVSAMLTEVDGTKYYTDRNGVEWVVVFTQIESTGWHLGLAQPRQEIIQPALAISRQVITGGAGLIVIVLLVSILLAQWISRPLLELSRTAQEIESSVDEESGKVLKPEQMGAIRGTLEIANLVSIFGQMVSALQKRMNELNSIYAMGQTITSNLDYEKTLQAVLQAVQQVVEFDAAEVSVVRGDQREVEAWLGQRGFKNTTGTKYRIDTGPGGLTIQTKAPLLIPVFSDEDGKSGGRRPAHDTLVPGSDVKIRSFLGVPLLIGDRLIGALTLVHRAPGHFTEADKRQLSKLTAQASIAIENAIQVRERENALKQQIRQLQIEIDEAKKTRQVEEIVDTEYFQKLKERATKMRKEAKGKGT